MVPIFKIDTIRCQTMSTLRGENCFTTATSLRLRLWFKNIGFINKDGCWSGHNFIFSNLKKYELPYNFKKANKYLEVRIHPVGAVVKKVIMRGENLSETFSSLTRTGICLSKLVIP